MHINSIMTEEYEMVWAEGQEYEMVWAEGQEYEMVWAEGQEYEMVWAEDQEYEMVWAEDQKLKTECPGRSGFLHSCEIKSGSGLGTRLQQMY